MNNKQITQLVLATKLVDHFNEALSLYMDSTGRLEVSPLEILDVLGVCGLELAVGERASEEYVEHMRQTRQNHPTSRLRLVK